MTGNDMEQTQRVIYLLSGYVNGTLNLAEAQELENWVAAAPGNHILFELMQDKDYRDQILGQWQPAAAEASLERVKQKITSQKQMVRRRRWLAAASVLLLLSTAGYYISSRLQQPGMHIAGQRQQDIMPGRNQATLTLADGSKITLNRELHGKLAQQGHTTITASGQQGVVYTAGATGQTASTVYNTLSTARGEQSPYPLTLPDGTKVWLNAASSITFPIVFNAHTRAVKITGEVYFEVAHQDNYPFQVAVQDQVVEDIGTHFNINAYEDEPVLKTTLQEGSVRIIRGSQQLTLAPGQQAINLPGDSIRIVEVDAVASIAWKEGLFRFNSEDLGSIMRNIARWYDVDVEYADPSAKALRFGAVAARFNNVSQVLHMLELTREVHFTIEGKKILVIKN